jgi:hypothetical protein
VWAWLARWRIEEVALAALRDRAEELKSAGMLLVLDAIWQQVTSPGLPRRRLVAVDEAQLLMRHAFGAAFLYRIAKAGPRTLGPARRGHPGRRGVLGSQIGLAIVANSATEILLRQAPQAIGLVAGAFGPSADERKLLLAARRGKGPAAGCPRRPARVPGHGQRSRAQGRHRHPLRPAIHGGFLESPSTRPIRALRSVRGDRSADSFDSAGRTCCANRVLSFDALIRATGGTAPSQYDASSGHVALVAPPLEPVPVIFSHRAISGSAACFICMASALSGLGGIAAGSGFIKSDFAKGLSSRRAASCAFL